MRWQAAWLRHACWLICLFSASQTLAADAVIVVAADGSPRVQFAAREVRRYVYLRTGELLPIHATTGNEKNSIRLLTDASLAPQTYRMQTLSAPGGGKTLTLSGGDDIAVLYAAYDFAEKLGVRFYLHGDVTPDRRIAFALPDLDETHAPLFESRGILPFHDFSEGPDWWELDDYKACFQQLAKMRMNLIGLHCYPEGPAGPEPLVWIGHPDDVDGKGKVAFSSPSFWAGTSVGSWGNGPVPTSAFPAGADQIFEEDDFGPSVTRGHRPVAKTPEGCNEVFERSAAMLHEAFQHGRSLGVKVCIGTEAPLHIPNSVQARLRQKGLDPNKEEVRQQVYEGIFTRIARAYPIDYYWLWTPESWTWAGAPQAQVDATVRDMQVAQAALKKVGSPFAFGTCGWELGPKQNRALFHDLLPKTATMSCINRNLGFNWVDQEFARVQGRPTWAIPWMEDDGVMVLPQLWAGRMRRDAADALAYNCTGLLGIHWRTKIISPNIAALAQSAWSQKGWNPAAGQSKQPPAALPADRKRDLPCDDFYADMAAAWFGPEVAADMARFFTRYDGDNGATGVIQGRAALPRPTVWLYGPGAIVPSRAPWAEESKRYAFVDELARLRERVQGAGNRERFDYWLNSFRYARALAEVACVRGELDAAMERMAAEKDAQRKKAIAVSEAVPIRIRLSRAWEQMIMHLLAATDSPGELGIVANLEQATRSKLKLLDGHDKAIQDALGEPLPEAIKLSSRYAGEPRIIVPTVRSAAAKGETLRLKVLILDSQPPAEAVLAWRTLGEGEFRTVPLRRVARGVHEAQLPAMPADQDAEFYLRVKTAAGKELVWPATAPAINQTLVQMPWAL